MQSCFFLNLRESSILGGTAEVEAGFYAIAYQFGLDALDGLAAKIVISRRGADTIFGTSERAAGGGDVANGRRDPPSLQRAA